MSLVVQLLLEVQGQQDPSPSFALDDHIQRLTFNDVNTWLSHWISQDNARLVAMDLQSYRNVGQDFPSRIFIEHLSRSLQLNSSDNISNSQLIVPTSSIAVSNESFKEAMRHQQTILLQTLNFSVRRSPKRILDSVVRSEQGR